jgi:hypothetical protein
VACLLRERKGLGGRLDCIRVPSCDGQFGPREPDLEVHDRPRERVDHEGFGSAEVALGDQGGGKPGRDPGRVQGEAFGKLQRFS